MSGPDERVIQRLQHLLAATPIGADSTARRFALNFGLSRWVFDSRASHKHLFVESDIAVDFELWCTPYDLEAVLDGKALEDLAEHIFFAGDLDVLTPVIAALRGERAVSLLSLRTGGG